MSGIQYDLSFIPRVFALPLDDIAAIYSTMGAPLTTKVIGTCIDELYAETYAIRYFPYSVIYPYLSEQSPFLVDYFQDWWIGGVHQMSAWTNYCWENLANMIETNNFSNSCYGYKLESHKSSPRDFLKENMEEILTVYNVYAQQQSESLWCDNLRQNHKIFRVNDTYAYLGSDITTCDINGDGKNEIIISAKGINNRGGVYILFYNDTWPNEVYLDSRKDGVIFIPYDGTFDSRFGNSIVCMDINQDGYDDLIVGIPGYNNDIQFLNNGKIEIYFANNIIQNAKTQKLVPDVIINSLEPYTNMGIKLSQSNNLLLIENYLTNVEKNINQGQLLILEPSKALEPQINCTVSKCTSMNINIINTGDNFCSWGGYNVVSWKDYLIISDIAYDNTGRIYCYSANDQIVWEIVGTYRNSRLGFDFIIENDTLIVSTPHNSDKTNHGAVYFIPLQKLFSNPGKYEINDFANETIFYASTQHTRFGWTMTHGNGKLYVGEPNYVMSEGSIHVISLPRNAMCYTTERKGSYFGKKVEYSSYGLLVSAPNESFPKEHSGAVYLILNI